MLCLFRDSLIRAAFKPGMLLYELFPYLLSCYLSPPSTDQKTQCGWKGWGTVAFARWLQFFKPVTRDRMKSREERIEAAAPRHARYIPLLEGWAEESLSR